MTFMTIPATMPPITTFLMFMAIRSSLCEVNAACVAQSVDYPGRAVKGGKREAGRGKREQEKRDEVRKEVSSLPASRFPLPAVNRPSNRLDCRTDRGATRRIAAAGS